MASSHADSCSTQETIPFDYVQMLNSSDPVGDCHSECQKRRSEVDRSKTFNARLLQACELTAEQTGFLQQQQRPGPPSLPPAQRDAWSALHPEGHGSPGKSRFDLMASAVVGTVLNAVGEDIASQIQEDEDMEEEDPDVAEAASKGQRHSEVLTTSFQHTSGDAGPSDPFGAEGLRVQNLHDFAFVHNRVSSWNVAELTAIFNMLDQLESRADMILLFETCGNDAFTGLPIIVRGYCNALLHRGCPVLVQRFLTDAYRLDDRLRASPSCADLVQLTLALADAQRSLFALNRELIRLRAAQADPALPVLDKHRLSVSLQALEATYAHAYDLPPSQQPPSDFSELHARLEGAFRAALAHYRQVFLVARTYQPLSSMCSMLQSYLAHWHPQAAFHGVARAEGLQPFPLSSAKTLLKCLTLLTFYALERDGGTEANDYSLHSALLQAVCATTSLHHLLPQILATLAPKIQHREQIRRTVWRVKHLSRMLAGEVDLSNVLQLLSALREEFMTSGKVALPPSSCDKDGAEELFRQLTFNFRGFMASPTPTYMPGNLQLWSGRVPDILINNADLLQLEGILRAWGLLDEPDPRVFLAALVKNVRHVFQTHRLQDLQSPSHSYFDACSDALIELAGIQQRKGTPALTNITTTLLFLGDCREHAFVMLSFFYFWQNRQLDKLLSRAFTLAMSYMETAPAEGPKDDCFQDIKTLLSETQNILNNHLRGAQVGVYAAVEMDNTYNFTGYQAPASLAELYDPRQRIYRLADFRAGNPLRPRDIQGFQATNSYFLLSYSDGTRGKVTCAPYVHPDTLVPLPDAQFPRHDMLVDLELITLMENHCMTMWVPNIRTCQVIEMMDSFYNHHYPPSPYFFGEGFTFSIKDIQDNGGLIPAATMQVKAAPDHQQSIAIPVYLDLLGYSKRTEQQATSETNQQLRYCGIPLMDLDIASIITQSNFVASKNRFSAGLLENTKNNLKKKKKKKKKKCNP